MIFFVHVLWFMFGGLVGFVLAAVLAANQLNDMEERLRNVRRFHENPYGGAS